MDVDVAVVVVDVSVASVSYDVAVVVVVASVASVVVDVDVEVVVDVPVVVVSSIMPRKASELHFILFTLTLSITEHVSSQQNLAPSSTKILPQQHAFPGPNGVPSASSSGQQPKYDRSNYSYRGPNISCWPQRACDNVNH